MNEYEALRREIEVRLQRETEYVVAQMQFDGASPEYKILKEKIEDNDKVIALIGKFLLEKGSEWEKLYQSKFPSQS